MERLTNRTPAGVANLNYPQSCFYPDGTKDQVAVSAYRQKAIDRLAAYEDTGLEPAEILTAKEQAEVACALNLLKEYQSLGSIEHFRELSQAEHDGLLVVLPVPVGPGKVAYGLTDPDYGPERIVTIECDHLERLEIWDNPGREVVVEVDGWEIGESDIGKFVFLTREQAKATLKKKKEENI